MIFMNDLNLAVSEEFFFLYLKCTGVYRQLARRIFLRQAALGGCPADEITVAPEEVQQAFDLFRMDNCILSRHELDSLLDVFGLQMGEVQEHLGAACRVERILTEKIRRGEFPDRAVLLELLFDERCRQVVTQASTWEIAAGRVSHIPDDVLAGLQQQARDRLLAINDIGDWEAYCADQAEMGLQESDIQRFVSVLARVEFAKVC